MLVLVAGIVGLFVAIALIKWAVARTGLRIPNARARQGSDNLRQYRRWVAEERRRRL